MTPVNLEASRDTADDLSFREQKKVLNNRVKFQEAPGVEPAKTKQNKTQCMSGLAMTLVQESKMWLMAACD